MTKYVKAPKEKEVKENKEDPKDLKEKAEPKTPEDLATKKELDTFRQDLDSIKMKLKEREEKSKKEDIMDEDTKKFLGRLQDSMGSIEKRLSKQEEKDRQAEALQREARREERNKEIIKANINEAVTPIAKSLADLGENLKIVRGMICNDKGECIVPTNKEVESLTGKMKDNLLNELKLKEEEKVKGKEPEKEKVKPEKLEKEEEKLPKGVLGTDLTLEEFLKDEKSQEVFVDKYLGDAGMRRALERCTSPECKVIREEIQKRGIKILKKREGGGMLGGDWEELD